MNELKYSSLGRFEIFLVATGLLFIFVGLYFSKNLTELDLISTELTAVGHTVEGSAKRKTERSLSWTSVKMDDVIYNNDQIFTNSQITVDINFNDKSSLNIQRNSLVRISKESGQDVMLEVQNGSLNYSTQSQEGTLRVKGSKGVLKISPKSNVRIEKINNEVVGVKLISGKAKIQRGNLSIKMLVGERKSLDESKNRYQSFLEVGEIDIFTQKQVRVKGNSGGQYLYVKSSESNEIRKLEIINNIVKINGLNLGQYIVSTDKFFKVIDTLNIVAPKELPIKLISNSIRAEDSVKLITPLRAEIVANVAVTYPKLDKVVEYKGVNPHSLSIPSYGQKDILVSIVPNVKVGDNSKISFKKKLKLNIKDLYQVKSVKSLSNEKVIKTLVELDVPLKNANHQVEVVKLKTNEVITVKIVKDKIEIDNLEKGDYEVRVVNNSSKLKLMSKVISVPDAVLISKQVTKNIGKKVLNEFSWKRPQKNNINNYEKFHVEVFDSKNTKVTNKVVGAHSFVFESDKIDDYRIRVSQIENGKKLELGVKKFKLLPPVNEVPRELDRYIMKYNKKNKCYNVQIPKYSTARKYFIEIYRDVKMVGLVREIWSDESSFCWRSSRDGRYFFRYKYIDYWGGSSKYSKISEIIFPISPLTDF